MRFNLFILAAAALFMTACGGSTSEGPKEVASKFIKHVNNLEFDKAKAYGTESTNQILDMIAGFAGMANEKPETTGFEILDVKEDGDKATVTYRNEGADADETISLVKKDGKWLVDMNKEDMDKEDGMDGDDMGDINWEESFEDATEDATDAIEDAADSAADAVEETMDEVEESVND